MNISINVKAKKFKAHFNGNEQVVETLIKVSNLMKLFIANLF